MEITTKNYAQLTESLVWQNAPEVLRKTHEQLIPAASKDGWYNYAKNETVRRVIDVYFKKLGGFLGNEKAGAQDKIHELKAAKEKAITAPKQRTAKTSTARKPVGVPKAAKAGHVKATKAPKSATEAEYATREVEHIDSDVAFIKRYVAMNGKTKTAAEILRLLKGLQKAILEHRITKQSPHAKEIKAMQDSLSKCYEEMNGTGSIALTINATSLKKYLAIAHSETKELSVTLLSAYIRLHGAKGMREAAKKLHQRIYKAVHTGKVPDNDKYISQLDKAFANLDNFIQARKPVLSLHEAELNGLSGIDELSGLLGRGSFKKKEAAKIGVSIHGTGHYFHEADIVAVKLNRKYDAGKIEGLAGINDDQPLQVAVDSSLPPAKPVQVMNSMDFARMKFAGIGLSGKWRDFIGDPSPNFTAMVFGKPKFGKSYLCIEFAGYLARHHGKVLYIAKEEGLDRTLQVKLNDKEVKHPNLDVAPAIPADLTPYKFVFFDSVNRLQLSPDDLNRLKGAHPAQAFIYIFQSTKEGNFRGANNFQHDVDVVIEVPERGKAIQFGRFNQGGEMNIF